MLGFRMVVALTYCMPISAMACSLTACANRGIEMHRTFEVRIKHEGKPLQGVTIKVTAPNGTVQFLGVTASQGLVQIAELVPGDYWLDANFLGITAANSCFHVSQQPSSRAKRQMRIAWGDVAHETRQIAGRLVDSQPGTVEGTLLNLVHRVNVPIVGATLVLQNPVTGERYSSTSNQNGGFAFNEAPSGIYVLHIAGGREGRTYDPTDVLVRLSPSADSDGIELIRTEPNGSSCGGTRLELRTYPSVQ